MTDPDPWGDLADAVERMSAARSALLKALDDVETAATTLDLEYIARPASRIRPDVLLDTIHMSGIVSDTIAAMSLRAGGHIPH